MLADGDRRRETRDYGKQSRLSLATRPSRGLLSVSAAGPVRSTAQDRLPFEIVAKIFLELVPMNAEAFDSCSSDHRYRGKMPHWLKVAHVCHYWRSIALSCRSLWSYIPLENLSWTTFALERSEDGPICIDAGPDVAQFGIPDPASLSVALSKAHRAQHISIATRENRCMSDSLETLRTSKVPRLERLELLFFRATSEQSFPMIPLDVFCKAAPPVLRTLVILDVFIAPGTSIFSATLTHLEMSIFTPAWDNLSQALDTLAGLPNLEFLALMRGTVLPPWHKGDPYAITGPRTIHLDRLKTLRLNGDACIVLRTLQTIRAPACEASNLIFALEQDPVPQDPSDVAAGLTHPRWPNLLSIPVAIASAYSADLSLSRSMTELAITSTMDPIWRTVSELTTFLRSFPNLRVLTIRCPPWHELPLRSDELAEPILMNNIQRLHLWSRFPHVVSTLSDYIQIPDEAERHATIDGGPPDTMSASEFASVARNILQLSALAPEECLSYRHLSVAEYKNDYYFGVCINVSNPTPPSYRQKPLPSSMELNIPLFALRGPAPIVPPPEVIARLAELMCALVKIFPLRACTDVSVSHFLFEDLSLWPRVFIHLEAVTGLTVRPGPRIARIAARALCVSRLPEAKAVLFPKLVTLYFEEVDLTDPTFLPCPFLISDDSEERNYPKFTLDIANSYVDDEMLSVLKRTFVRGVRWDGLCDTSIKMLSRPWKREVSSTVPSTAPSRAVPIVPIDVGTPPAATA